MASGVCARRSRLAISGHQSEKMARRRQEGPIGSLLSFRRESRLAIHGGWIYVAPSQVASHVLTDHRDFQLQDR